MTGVAYDRLKLECASTGRVGLLRRNQIDN